MNKIAEDISVGRTDSAKDIVTVLIQSLEALLEQVEHYRNKVLRTEEAEDLHQFRIALRRSVVLMGEFSFLDENGTILEHRKALKKLISMSNLERDLDVFKICLEALETHFPDEKEMFGDLFRYLLKRKKDAHQKFLTYLQSRKCTDVFVSWRHSLQRWQKDEPSIYTYASAKSVSSYVISQRLLKIRTQIKALEKSQNDVEERLHALRISYKKLRYLLESFGSLFKKKKIGAFLKEIKKIQDVLGVFHDSYQQRMLLRELLKKTEEKQMRDFIESVLLPEIVRSQAKEIAKVEKRLGKFLKKEKAFRKHFG